MALELLKFKPGVDVESTALLSGASWNTSQLIRFRAGLPEKLGGWQHLNSQPLIGTGRGMHCWADLNGISYAAVGTEQRLQLFTGGLLFDITPLRATSNIAPNFSTIAGSTTVGVTNTAHGAGVDDWVNIVDTVSVGGILLQGFYIVTGVLDPNNFTIAASSPATSTVANGGIGDYGAGDYGLGGAGSATDIAPLRQWFLSNWGQDLIGNYTGGTLYYWTPPEAAGDIAIPTGGTTPTIIEASFVSMPAQIAVALGAETTGIFDPNLVRWSTQDDFTDWVATSSNQAGSFRLPTGSRIVGGLQGPQFGFVWTDIDLWIMQYIGTPFIFGFNKIAGGTSLLAGHAAGVYKSTVYWAAPDNFCMFDGSTVQILPCPVWDAFFFNLNAAQIDKVFCAVNSSFNEVSWFYPSAGSTEVDSYVKFNVVEGTWDYGTLTRTCWEDKNVFGPAIGCDTSGRLQQHEIGYDADGAPMDSWIQSGFMELGGGDLFTFVERLIGDFTMFGGTAPFNRVTVSLIFQDYPNDPVRIYGPYPWSTSGPQYSIVRGRSRTAAVRIESTDPGVFWRLGALRLKGAPAGKR
jgi:hypothetical protein